MPIPGGVSGDTRCLSEGVGEAAWRTGKYCWFAAGLQGMVVARTRPGTAAQCPHAEALALLKRDPSACAYAQYLHLETYGRSSPRNLVT